VNNSQNNYFIEGERVYLREVRVSDVNDAYYGWINDGEVNRYLESRFFPQSKEQLVQFVERYRNDENHTFFAIILKDEHRHIGNVKLGPINWIHRLSDIGIIIGEKDCWGKHYASEALHLIVKYAFNKLNLHKITAGCVSSNVSAIKAFQRSGFEVEGIRKQHAFVDGRYENVTLLGIIKSDEHGT